MRWLASWLLYLVGSAFAPLTHLLDFEWPHRLSSWFMLCSDAVQGQGNGPWQDGAVSAPEEK